MTWPWISVWPFLPSSLIIAGLKSVAWILAGHCSFGTCLRISVQVMPGPQALSRTTEEGERGGEEMEIKCAEMRRVRSPPAFSYEAATFSKNALLSNSILLAVDMVGVCWLAWGKGQCAKVRRNWHWAGRMKG